MRERAAAGAHLGCPRRSGLARVGRGLGGACVLAFALGVAGCSSNPASNASSTDSTSVASGRSDDGAAGAAGGASSGGSSAKASGATPELLSIPSLKLTTGLTPQGLTNGEVNPRAGQTIWFTGSSRVAPGSKGTAVIAGHVADGAKPDVFARLGSLPAGGSFDLTMSNGATQKFRVVRAGVVGKQALRHDQTVWGANTSSTRVVLVTCDDELGFGSDGHRRANYVVVGEAK